MAIDYRAPSGSGDEQAPVLMRAGAAEVKFADKAGGFAVGGAAIGERRAGSGGVGVVAEDDFDVAGVPAVQDDRGGVGAEQFSGDLNAGKGRLGRGEQWFELAVLAGSQDEQDLIGEPTDDASLVIGRFRGGAVRSGGSWRRGAGTY